MKRIECQFPEVTLQEYLSQGKGGNWRPQDNWQRSERNRKQSISNIDIQTQKLLENLNSRRYRLGKRMTSSIIYSSEKRTILQVIHLLQNELEVVELRLALKRKQKELKE